MDKILKTFQLMALLLLANFFVDAQKPLSLKECIYYSLQNNSKVKIAVYDVDASKQRVREQLGAYLPQLNGSGSFDNNLRLTTQLLPGELAGKPGELIPVTFGTKYNVSGGLQFTQKIYDRPGMLGIKSAKINNQVSEQNQQKTLESTIYSISMAYYQSLVIQMQVNTLKSNLKTTEKLLKATELRFNNGMAKKIDVDKIRVNFNNTSSQLEQAELSYAQTLNNLKFQMGMPIDSSITIPDSLPEANYDDLSKASSETFSADKLVDYKLVKTNFELSQVEKRRSLAAFQPTLSFYSNLNVMAMRREFNFFEAGQKWFPSYGVGLKLSVPVFDGFQRNARVSQSEISVQKANENIKLTEQAIKVDFSNYEIKYKNALDNIKKEKDNLDLAESVYKNTQLEFQQGTGSTLDLIQSENSYMVAQNSYFNKLLDLFIARIEKEKAMGNLISYINNQK